MPSKRYDDKALIDAYIAAQKQNYVHPDFPAYYKSLLAALEKRFQFQMSGQGVLRNVALWMLFNATVNSYLSIRTPYSGFLESGIIEQTIDNLPDQGVSIRQHLTNIGSLTKASQTAHLALLHALFTAMFGEVSTVVTSEQLLADGFDDSTEPDMSDYWDYV